MRKQRLDHLMVQRSLAPSREQAQKFVMAGLVRVDGQRINQPSALFLPTVEILVETGARFVSRGGDKLAAALVAFGLEQLQDHVCADVGASTGGFTDCLLQHGAGRVYAIDVGYGDLHWKLRNDPRVVVMERTNARYVQQLPEPIWLACIDASFISLQTLLPVVQGWFAPDGGRVVALIKPQFEASRDEVTRGEGVIRDAAIHQRVLMEVLEAAAAQGFGVAGLIRSPLKGPKGNSEFLTLLTTGAAAAAPTLEALIARALAGAPS